MDLEDGLPTSQIRPVHDHLAVEPPRANQRRVQNVRTVGGGHDDHALGGVEAVHLRQQLVERLLALVVTADEAAGAGARLADGVQLVDEDDAGRLVLGLLEEVAHACGAHAHEHLDELGAGQREERHVGLTGDRAGQQRLAGAGRTDEEDALGQPAAEALILAWVLEEVDDLDQLRLRLVDAGHVGEGRLQLLAVEDLVLAAPERQCLRRSAAHAAHEEHPDRDHDRERDDPAEEQILPERGLDAAGKLHVVRAQLVHQLLIVDERDPRGDEDPRFLLGAEDLA